MLTTTDTVKKIVYGLANMKGDRTYRRYWCDKTLDKTSNERLLAFRFVSASEADAVVAALTKTLKTCGFTNVVKRTRVVHDWSVWQEGGEYVRVKAVLA